MPVTEAFVVGRWVIWKDFEEAKTRGFLGAYGTGPFEIHDVREEGTVLDIIHGRTGRPPVLHITGVSSEFFKSVD